MILDGWVDEWLDGFRMGGWMNECVGGKVLWVGGWMAGWLAGWMDGWMDGWMRVMDVQGLRPPIKQVYRFISLINNIYLVAAALML